MQFRSEVSSCASRPIEALIWINEIESAKCNADLKTSYSMCHDVQGDIMTEASSCWCVCLLCRCGCFKRDLCGHCSNVGDRCDFVFLADPATVGRSTRGQHPFVSAIVCAVSSRPEYPA